MPGLTNIVRWQNALARGAAELDVLPERFRRPHRQPRDAGRPGAAREQRTRRSAPSGTSSSTAAARWCCSAATDWRLAIADGRVVRRLRDVLCASSCRGCATARSKVSEVRSALTGRVVDSYTNILTVKLFARAARRGRVRARRDRRAHRRCSAPSCARSPRYSLTLITMNATMVVGDRRASRSGYGCRADLGRRGRDGAAAGAGRSPTWPAGWRRTSPRSSRMSAWCRTACARSRCRGRCRTRRTPPSCGSAAARSGSSTCVSATAPSAACCTICPRHRAGERVGLVGAVRRRQIDPGQSAAALLRAGMRPHPDRRPGHRRRHARRACARRSPW